MVRQFNIRQGVAVNQDEVVRSLKEKGFYSSGVPRTMERTKQGPKALQISHVELFGNYVDAKIHNREKEFLKSLTLNQFTTLCASLEGGTK